MKTMKLINVSILSLLFMYLLLSISVVYARHNFKKAKSFLSGMYDIMEVDAKDPNDFELNEDDFFQFKNNFFNFLVEDGRAEDVDEVLTSQHGKRILVEKFGSGTIAQTVLNPIIVGTTIHRATKVYLKFGEFYENLNIAEFNSGKVRPGISKSEQQFYVTLQLELEKLKKLKRRKKQKNNKRKKNIKLITWPH